MQRSNADSKRESFRRVSLSLSLPHSPFRKFFVVLISITHSAAAADSIHIYSETVFVRLASEKYCPHSAKPLCMTIQHEIPTTSK